MKKILFILAMLFGASISDAQQKAMYSQYMFNGLALNPAYSATDDALTATALSRHQWVGFVGAPNTQTFSLHGAIKESNTSAGMLLIRDQIGEVLAEKGAYFTAAQRVPISENSYLAVGINAGVSLNSASYSDKFNESQSSVNDPAFQDARTTSANLGFGVMLFSDNYYVGFSSPHFYYRDFASPGETVAVNHRPHYMLQGGFVTPLNDGLRFKPNFLVKYVNGSPVQFDVNANFLINETVWLGASYRSLDSFDALAEVFVSPTVSVGYSYDFTTTVLRQVQKGTHEIMLKLRLPGKEGHKPRCYF